MLQTLKSFLDIIGTGSSSLQRKRIHGDLGWKHHNHQGEGIYMYLHYMRHCTANITTTCTVYINGQWQQLCFTWWKWTIIFQRLTILRNNRNSVALMRWQTLNLTNIYVYLYKGVSGPHSCCGTVNKEFSLRIAGIWGWPSQWRRPKMIK